MRHRHPLTDYVTGEAAPAAVAMERGVDAAAGHLGLGGNQHDHLGGVGRSRVRCVSARS